jgi:hypothetical protein
MASERFEFDIALTAREHRAYAPASSRRIAAVRIAATAATGAVGGFVLVLIDPATIVTPVVAACVAALAFQSGWSLAASRSGPHLRKRRDDGAVDRFHMIVDSTGIRTVYPTREWLTRWEGYQTLRVLPGALVVLARASRPAIIPRRCIASPADGERLERFIRTRIETAGA